MLQVHLEKNALDLIDVKKDPIGRKKKCLQAITVIKQTPPFFFKKIQFTKLRETTEKKCYLKNP